MPRFFLTIEYDGTDFVGWQRQDNGVSVQALLEEAGSAILGHRQPVPMQAAGRTDAGVHALAQIVHCDLPAPFTAEKVPLALNAHLVPSIRVVSARQVEDNAHARFDAISRRYLYRILTRRVASALDGNRLWHIGAVLDTDAMRAAAQHLIGKHDFTSFRSTHCQAENPSRTLDRLDISASEHEVRIIAEARSFLHHQVRNITGSLVLVGQGKWKPDDMASALAACDRSAAGPTAPPHGLYLIQVGYPY